MVPTVAVTRRGVERLRAAHPWIFRSDIATAQAGPGDLVLVTSERGRPLGWAFWSSQSQIALRMMAGPASDGPPDERTLLAERLRAAIAYRESLAIDATCLRLVHGEADRLPALIVDRYGDGSGQYLVVQTLSQGMDRRRDLVVALLVDLLQPRGILARNDARVRQLEGLEEQVEVVAGDVPEVIEVREGAVRLAVDVRHGQKTGLFLDQRENHAVAAMLARGRALDAFAYQGGFALAMAVHAESVLALDSSEPAVAIVRANAARNGLSNLEVREANVFDELRELAIVGAQFETIVLDPPAFAKNKASVDRALAGYKEINLRAMRLLRPGGHLITCTCSHNVDAALFDQVLASAAADAHATMIVAERRTQARDHPILATVPETAYLKCVVLRRVA
jgi:23S rRNA (cytosine1962-C5)-methyltransferase